MEKNIRSKVTSYESEFKDNLKQWIMDNDASIICGNTTDRTNDFIQHLSDFPRLELNVKDFQKRKRIKNSVPDYNRCIAMKCNGERCSRKQKGEDTQFCGTHIKGAPHGTFSTNQEISKKKQINLWLQDFMGVSRYIDNNENVYSTPDILNKVNPPRIIGKYRIKEDKETYYMIQD
tara:strand:- start:3403 stop:3930 length:528 start_codon:yes stop_codon:yes gene_type:complete